MEVRSLRTGRTIYTHTTRFGAGGLAFTADGRELVASDCCTDGAAFVGWDARSGAQRFRRKVTENSAAFALSPKGNRWRSAPKTGESCGGMRAPAGRSGRRRRSRAVVELAFSPDGRLLAVSSGPVVLLDVATRKRVGSGFTTGDKGWVPGIVFEPNGRLLIFGLHRHDRMADGPADPASRRLPDRRPRPRARGVAGPAPEPAVPSRLPRMTRSRSVAPC